MASRSGCRSTGAPRKFYRDLRARLIAHAEAVYRLDTPRKDGSTLRQHLQAVWRASGRKPKELDIPEMPPMVAHLWDIFGELSVARGSNGFGINAINYREITSWQHLSGVTLTPWEAETLIHLDRAVRAILSKD